ncbi:MAG: multidrug effflux MFS transporter [Rhizobiales bacterium]|nr:multidrug effflux MFS transporter [Hyphomicrobiales bacterium]
MSHTPDAPPRLPPVWLLFAMMFVGQFATNVYLPGMADIASDLETSLSSVQLLVPAYLASFAFAQLVMGPLSDRFGRRPVIIAGLGIFTVASIACVFAPDIPTLIMARVFQATGACATIVVGRAMIRDTSEGVAAAQAMAFLAIAMGIGPATSPFIGGFLVTWFGWKSTFLVTAAVGALVFACVVPMLEETLPRSMRNPPAPGQLLVEYFRLMRMRLFVTYSITVSFSTAAAQVYLTSIPIVFTVLMGVEPELVGFFIMMMPPFFMTATWISRRLANHLPIDRIILIGVAISASGGLLQFIFGLWGVNSPYPVMAAFAISNFGTGMVFANCYAQALSSVPPAIAGSASALGGFIHMSWGAMVSLAVASVVHTSSLQMGIAQMATTFLGLPTAIVLIFVFKRLARSG